MRNKKHPKFKHIKKQIQLEYRPSLGKEVKVFSPLSADGWVYHSTKGWRKVSSKRPTGQASLRYISFFNSFKRA